MPRTRKSKNSKNRSPRYLRPIGNLAVNGLERGVKGISNLGVGAIRLSGQVLRLGTGAANRVIGATKRISNRFRKSIRKSYKK